MSGSLCNNNLEGAFQPWIWQWGGVSQRLPEIFSVAHRQYLSQESVPLGTDIINKGFEFMNNGQMG